MTLLRSHDLEEPCPTPRSVLEDVAREFLLTVPAIRKGSKGSALVRRARRAVVERLDRWGYTNQEIAELLRIDHSTVYYYRRRNRESQP